MIEKMKYISMIGHLRDIDRVIEKYISNKEIQLEYTVKELKDMEGIQSLTLPNPYAFPLRIAERFVKATGLNTADVKGTMSELDAYKYIEKAEEIFTRRSKQMNQMAKEKKKFETILSELEPFIDLEFNMESLDSFSFINCHFGKMPVNSFKQYETFMYHQTEILFMKGKSDKEYVWGAYLSSETKEEEVKAIFESLNFKELNFTYKISDIVLKGTPRSVYEEFSEKLAVQDAEIAAVEAKILDESELRSVDIILAYNKLNDLFQAFDLKKYAAHTYGSYYIFVGWMPEKDAFALSKEVEEDPNVIMEIKGDTEAKVSTPPTKLKNPKIFQPFEMFVKMYGLPSYGEFDPTIFVAITYTILFGVMFGDIGQGLIVSAVGLFLYKKKGIQLGSILAIVGVSSMFFGAMYGSIFGFEHVLPTLWMKPSHNVNFILILTVGVGVLLNLYVMVLNMINMFKSKKYLQMFFSPNGLFGMVFYMGVIGIAVAALFADIKVAISLIIIFVVLPLILITFREPIIRILQKQKDVIHGNIAFFFIETAIELLEMLLSYISNSISYVRVGAFALSHAGMMSVVMLLSNAESGDGSINWIVVILGNILVMGLEGLAVGIQVLRLEYYEMFSRFFKGEGRQFSPVKHKNK